MSTTPVEGCVISNVCDACVSDDVVSVTVVRGALEDGGLLLKVLMFDEDVFCRKSSFEKSVRGDCVVNAVKVGAMEVRVELSGVVCGFEMLNDETQSVLPEKDVQEADDVGWHPVDG